MGGTKNAQAGSLEMPKAIRKAALSEAATYGVLQQLLPGEEQVLIGWF